MDCLLSLSLKKAVPQEIAHNCSLAVFFNEFFLFVASKSATRTKIRGIFQNLLISLKDASFGVFTLHGSCSKQSFFEFAMG